jgi:hypothetical protein
MERIPVLLRVDTVLDFIKEEGGLVKNPNKKRADFDNISVKVFSHRYINFIHNGTKCVCCGVEGKTFFLERHTVNEGYHFNLYAQGKYGEELLMTKDHILAKKLGGKDRADNYQTMCSYCNGKKSSMTVDEWETYQKEHPTRLTGMPLDKAKTIAEEQNKKLFVIPNKDYKLFIATDIKEAQSKFAKSKVYPYKD